MVIPAAPLVAQSELPGTEPLAPESVDPADMVAGIGQFLSRDISAAREAREQKWKPDVSSLDAFDRWMDARRERLRRILGVVDAREPVTAIELVATTTTSSLVGEGEGYKVHQVRWPVLPGVHAEGLLLEPDAPLASVVALGDADWTPEQLAGLAPGVSEASQFARRLAENRCRVLVPVLMDRADTYSGNPAIRMTNQPHREFVYRAAFQMGRHIIGYEVQKVLAAVDWFEHSGTGRSRLPGGTSSPAAPPSTMPSPGEDNLPTGIIGYGEGGLLAFYAAAIDPRIDAVGVSGYFGPREGLPQEPIYRNVWTLLRDFGDAELLTMIAPRTALIEASRAPKVTGPPAPHDGRAGAAAGRIDTPPIQAIRDEFERAQRLLPVADLIGRFELVEAETGGYSPIGSQQTLFGFLHALGIHEPIREGAVPRTARLLPDAAARTKRQFDELNEFTQRLVRSSPERRLAFWSKADASSLARWQETTKRYRDYYWDEVIGRLPKATIPVHPRSRRILEDPKWQAWEVKLDVYPDVFASGILFVPRDLKPGERRPVVVCQHGLEGTSESTITSDEKKGFGYYQRVSPRLAERGYIVYAPQNPYIGGDTFRMLQRQANPLGLSIFSFIVRQHERTLEWLASLPFVDGGRIGFYGLSYGGKTAMRIPALLPQYALSICSADFNEWIWKMTSLDFKSSYMFVGEWEMYDFDMGNTFNYAELAGLIAPRPFMVERGSRDPVGIDEWVAYEYARVRRLYADLGIPALTEIEFFQGPHQIHGAGSFAFLDRHLRPRGE